MVGKLVMPPDVRWQLPIWLFLHVCNLCRPEQGFCHRKTTMGVTGSCTSEPAFEESLDHQTQSRFTWKTLNMMNVHSLIAKVVDKSSVFFFSDHLLDQNIFATSSECLCYMYMCVCVCIHMHRVRLSAYGAVKLFCKDFPMLSIFYSYDFWYVWR